MFIDRKKLLALPLLSLLLSQTMLYAKTYSFEDTALGKTPKEWICATRYAQQWSVTQTQNESHVLTLRSSDAYGSHFNTCYTNADFLNGTISLKFKAKAGRGDRGGGIMWRVIDADNYYIVRYNPLEDNLTFYYVKNGYRSMQNNINMHLKRGVWHSMKVVQHNAHYAIYLDNKKMLEGVNKVFENAGGVGVWTKADALTSFDDIVVQKEQ